MLLASVILFVICCAIIKIFDKDIRKYTYRKAIANVGVLVSLLGIVGSIILLIIGG